MWGVATSRPANMRPPTSTRPAIRSSRVMIRRKVGDGVMSTKSSSTCRTKRPSSVRYRVTCDEPVSPSRANAGYDGGMSSDPYDRPAQTFPKLPPEMIDRIKPYGRPDSFDGGAYLYRVGDRNVDFLILEGAVDILESN